MDREVVGAVAFISCALSILIMQICGIPVWLLGWALAAASSAYLFFYYTLGYIRSGFSEERRNCASVFSILSFLALCTLLATLFSVLPSTNVVLTALIILCVVVLVIALPVWNRLRMTELINLDKEVCLV